MAKRINPYPSNETPPEFKKIVTSFITNGVLAARQFVQPPAQSPEYLAEQSQLYQDAIAAWGRLHTWKRVRWSLCAISKWGEPDTLMGANGYSGFSLYVQCWLEQKPLSDKQPISPCSARATDPDANPWNYQP